MNRYARQMILPEIGAVGQARLAAAHVLVVGAGGLGCPVLSYLSGAGVGRITLVDPDHVDESNLHRQPLYELADLGVAKVDAARRHLLSGRPDLQIEVHSIALDPANAPGLVVPVDVVIDAADSFAVSYILSDTCLRLETPLISASVLAQAGYVGGYCGASPSLRAVFPDLPDSGATCATAGVMGPVVGMLGTMLAQGALQVLLGHAGSIMGRVVSVDMASWKFGGFSFDGAEEPEVLVPFVGRGEVSGDDLAIELRSAKEAPEPAVPDARRIAPARMADFVPDHAGRIVLCCKSGLRAWRAAEELRKRGFGNLAVLAAGDAP